MQPSTWILAQQTPWKYMGRNFKGEEAKLQTGDVLALAAIVGVVILGAWALTRLLARQDRRRRFNSPAALFNTLCKVHGLAVAERKLLLGHARQQGLSDPGRMFLEPLRFNTTQDTAAGETDHAQLKSLRARLFGERASNDSNQGWAGAAAGAVASAGAAASAVGATAPAGDLPAS
jgi:hypothetical protein